MSHQAMSMEAMLDEERREVLALLEGGAARQRAPSIRGEGRSPSPFTTPRSPVRSMLDIGHDSPPPITRVVPSGGTAKKSPTQTAPVRSMLDVDTTSGPLPVRSMLDVESPPLSSTKSVFANADVNNRAYQNNQAPHPRSLSDASSRPVDFGPRSSASRLDPTSEYQFSGILTNNDGQSLPKRVAQGGKRSGLSMAEVMRGSDVPGIVLPGDKSRHYSIAGPSSKFKSNKSKSPSSRLGFRSNSPRAVLSGRPLSPAGRALLVDNPIDYQNAYRRLSDANLALSGGSLSSLPRRKRSDDVSGSGRLEKTYLSPDGDLLEDDSSDDRGASSSDDESHRGRRAARLGDDNTMPGSSPVVSGSPLSERKALSLLAAAEEERIQVANTQPSYQYRSLLDDPEITVTNPSGERVKQSKAAIHPATSFDLPPRSGSRTPMDSDTEADLTDIKRAQNLSFSMSNIIDHPEYHRTIRVIARGEYAKIVQEAEEEHRRLRKYLVATDLSEESTHALEWAIGTVLRDGDTMIAIYCVDEETGIVTGDGQLVPDDPKAIREQAAVINTITSGKPPLASSGAGLPLLYRSSPLTHAADASSLTPSPAPSVKERSKAQEERLRAVRDIQDRVTRLLRKTRLQVRVIVEVLHCKNPKHLLTEVIDLINPTLVILGSRGRSALKGVILGSFSNYLVTKSSVPVMVARKRLRKHSKYKRPIHVQVNNISNPTARSLANAKID